MNTPSSIQISAQKGSNPLLRTSIASSSNIKEIVLIPNTTVRPTHSWSVSGKIFKEEVIKKSYRVTLKALELVNCTENVPDIFSLHIRIDSLVGSNGPGGQQFHGILSGFLAGVEVPPVGVSQRLRLQLFCAVYIRFGEPNLSRPPHLTNQ